MKPKIMHQQAMEFSFLAKKAQSESNYSLSIEYFEKAAALESEVAEFYFDKPELEPTRSVLIRSAAFLNLKAGLINEAQKFIFFGILNLQDDTIKHQLNDALELSMSLKNMTQSEAHRELDYLRILRQRSVHYVLEPSDIKFGHSVSLEMIKHFVDGYLKSLKAYGVSKLKSVINVAGNMEDEFAEIINPLVTQSAYGSFKFSIANDFLPRVGEKKEIVDLKSTVIQSYHKEIFTNPLTDESIEQLKQNFDVEDMNKIFRPLTQIKSNRTAYKIAYFDIEDSQKVFSDKIVNKQKTKLITPNTISQEDIGELESLIVHKSTSDSGVKKRTLFKEELKSYAMELSIDQIEAVSIKPIILSENIIVSFNFSSDSGFTLIFDDLNIVVTEIVYSKAIESFHNVFYDKIKNLSNESDKNEMQLREWEIVKKLIANPSAII